MSKYTDEKQNDFQAMLKTISAHKDFGKRNPVDIGIECGYTKEDVLDMIQMIQSKKNSVQENESSIKEDKNDREEYYFLFHRGYEKDAYIVSLDINNWSTKIVKVVTPFDRNRFQGETHSVGRWQIKDNIFVWTQRIWEKNSIRSIEKTVYWENLKTGEQRKLLIDDDVANVLIRDSDTCIFTSGEVIIWGNDDKIEKRKIGWLSGCGDLIFEENKQIYVVGSGSIYKYDSDFNEKKFEWSQEYGYRVKAVEFEDGKLSWYEAKENIHVFSDNDWSYRKRKEDKVSYSMNSEGLFASRLEYSAGILKGIFTQNYRLLQDEIRSIDNEKAICSFKRKVDKDSHCGQVIGIPDKDIFIGIGGDKNNEYLIKIDLRNERQAIIIPVELPQK